MGNDRDSTHNLMIAKLETSTTAPSCYPKCGPQYKGYEINLIIYVNKIIYFDPTSDMNPFISSIDSGLTN